MCIIATEKKYYDTKKFNHAKDEILNRFNESNFGSDLHAKEEIVKSLDNIITNPPVIKNVPASVNQRQYIALKNWYDDNQVKLDELESRRGKSKFWDLIDAIKNTFSKVFTGKNAKKTTIGVTGVKVTESMHNHFKEKPKKVNIQDQKNSKTPRSST